MPIYSGGGGGGGGAATTVRYPNDYLTAFGWKSESVERAAVTGTSGPPSGELRLTSVPLHAGDAITNAVFGVVTGPTALTLARVGIYRPDTFALVASSTDQHALPWSSGTWQAVPLSATFNVVNTDVYLVGLLCVGTTPPLIAAVGNGSLSDVTPPPNNNRLIACRQTGLADLPNPLVEVPGNVVTYIALY